MVIVRDIINNIIKWKRKSCIRTTQALSLSLALLHAHTFIFYVRVKNVYMVFPSARVKIVLTQKINIVFPSFFLFFTAVF